MMEFRIKLGYFFVIIFAITTMFSCGGGASTSGGEINVRQALGDSGYDYIVHTSTGNRAPQDGDNIEFDLFMYSEDGKLLNSSLDQPQKPTLFIDAANKKMFEKNPLMKLASMLSEGDSASLFIPVDSMGNNPNIPPNTKEVIYSVASRLVKNPEEMGIIKAQRETEEAERLQAAKVVEEEKLSLSQGILNDHLAGKSKYPVVELEGGLKLLMIEEGTGDLPTAGQSVSVNYMGMLKDGTSFDNSFKRGQKFSFPLGQGRVIQGWDKGFAAMKGGSKALLDIPFEMAYGAQGRPPSIPAESDLYFYVELD